MQPTNGTRFLAAFNDIESHLRRVVDRGDHVDFGELVRSYPPRGLTPDQRQALFAFAALRNAISHGRYYDGKPIAEPVPDVVVAIENLRDQLESPPRVLSVLGSMDVASLSPGDPITKALDYVRDRDYSQFPVYAGDQYLGLLTTNAIARWLAGQLASTGGLAEAETVSEVMEFVEPYEKAKLVGRGVTATSAIHELSGGESAAHPVIALIITDGGKRTERPLAVVVADDLPKLYAALA